MKNQTIERLREIKFVALATFRLPKQISNIQKVIEKPSYYPEKPRKSKHTMWIENFLWLLKNHELNPYYTSYGLDVKNFRNKNEFIPRHEFCRERNIGNQRVKNTISGSYNYIALLRDKYIFSAYLSSTLGTEYLPETIAFINGSRVYDARMKKWILTSEFFKEDKTVVFKLIDGECAEGVALVSVQKGKIVKGGKTIDWKTYLREFPGDKILVQEVLKQHHKIAELNPYCINTIRIITIRGKSGRIQVFAAFLRLGASEDSFVDNRAKGGLGVGIDLSKGVLMKYGFVHDEFGLKEEQHPLTGVEFAGYEIPFWKEVVDLVKNAHAQFYSLQSIGWDIVITEKGPVLLEGNDDWEIGGPQDTYGGLKKRWNELRKANEVLDSMLTLKLHYIIRINKRTLLYCIVVISVAGNDLRDFLHCFWRRRNRKDIYNHCDVSSTYCNDVFSGR